MPCELPICSLTLRVGSFDAEILPAQRARLQKSKEAMSAKSAKSAKSARVLFGMRCEEGLAPMRQEVNSVG